MPPDTILKQRPVDMASDISNIEPEQYEEVVCLALLEHIPDLSETAPGVGRQSALNRRYRSTPQGMIVKRLLAHSLGSWPELEQLAESVVP